MEPLHQPTRQRPEEKIQLEIMAALRARGWWVNRTHGNACQSGFPDLYCFHETKGIRWIEVKNPKKFAFTEAQKIWYPRYIRCKVHVWVLMGASDTELQLLDGPPNLELILKRKALGR